MVPDDFIQLLRTQPFVPFVVFMNDGSMLPVNHPDQAMVSGEMLYVAHDNRGVRCSIMNVTRVETSDITPPKDPTEI
ncbi:MAG: hypothetical protein AAF790_08180 [Planctomycetota bacterium]